MLPNSAANTDRRCSTLLGSFSDDPSNALGRFTVLKGDPDIAGGMYKGRQGVVDAIIAMPMDPNPVKCEQCTDVIEKGDWYIIGEKGGKKKGFCTEQCIKRAGYNVHETQKLTGTTFYY